MDCPIQTEGRLMNWQPWQTAPKDQRILVTVSHEEESRKYDETGNNPVLIFKPIKPFVAFAEWPTPDYDGKNWGYDGCDKWGNAEMVPCMISAWMPIPAPFGGATATARRMQAAARA